LAETAAPGSPLRQSQRREDSESHGHAIAGNHKRTEMEENWMHQVGRLNTVVIWLIQ
jgi:hypothetical protein